MLIIYLVRIAEYVNHTALKPRPDTVIKTPLDSLGFDSGFMQSINDLLSDLLASYIRKFFLVVVARKAIETANFSAMFFLSVITIEFHMRSSETYS